MFHIKGYESFFFNGFLNNKMRQNALNNRHAKQERKQSN